MSLIDQDITNKQDNEKQPKEVKCLECKKDLIPTSQILLCENCFNASVKKALDAIVVKVNEIYEHIAKIDKATSDINKALSDNNDKKLPIVLINKLEIDLLNYECIKRKLEIDLEINERAFAINQTQANTLRTEMGWTLFDVIEFPKGVK